MKKRSLNKISFKKNVISSLQENKKITGLLGGFGRPIEGTSPKCGISEIESCHGSCNVEN